MLLNVFRQQLILDEKMAELAQTSMPEDQIELIRQSIIAQGLNLNLLNAVLAIFLKGAVAAAMALAISTLASSTLFTIIAVSNPQLQNDTFEGKSN